MNRDVPSPSGAGPSDAGPEAAGAVGSPGADAVPFGTAARAWFLISLQTFGGPAGQIAVMQRTLVEERRWIGPRRFQHALNYCMLLPGPEAQQLATYTGWLLNGVRGGLVAGGLFVLPGLVSLLALSVVYVALGETAVVSGVFLGLAPAVIAVVAQAVVRLGRRSLTHPALVGLAVAAFLALALLAVPFPVVVLAAGAVGAVLGRVRPSAVGSRGGHGSDDGPVALIPDDRLHGARPSLRRTLTVLVVGLGVWALPVLVALVTLGRGSVLVEQALFFSGTAVVTFGGAYAVLSYVAQQAVSTYQWLLPGEMARGLALAETTPGPLIMVVQFVAFLGAYRSPGTLDPWVAAVLASLLTTWVTFVPSVLLVLLGAPSMERLRGHRGLASVLTGISAAVVGVIAHLGVYFSLHTLFARTTRWSAGPLQLEVPVPDSLQPAALAVAVVAAVLVFGLRWPVLRTLGVCALLGLTLRLSVLA